MAGPAKGSKMLADPKQCTRCKQLKPRSEFGKHQNHAGAPLAVRSRCHRCEAADAREANLKDKSVLKKRNRKAKLKRAYGITLEIFEAMLAAQGGCCALCHTDTPGGRGVFHVDHDHYTGKIRALLCAQCNVGLGSFNDSPELLNEAARYLIARKGLP